MRRRGVESICFFKEPATTGIDTLAQRDALPISWWGGAAAGIGSMLVDLLGGYASFVPGTLVIKFLDAMAAALVVKALGKGYVSYIVGGVVGEAIMVAGYFAYEGLILGMGMGAAAGIPSNLVQAVTGIVIALVLVALLKGSKALDKIAVQW